MCNKLLIFFSLITLSYTEPKYCKLSDALYYPIARELKEKKGLQLIGTGGAMKGDIQKIFMHYISHDQLSIEAARKLYVEVAEEYLKQYNAFTKLRPYFHNYPLTIKNIDLQISFSDQEEKVQTAPNAIASISKVNGDQLYYDRYEDKKYVQMHKESYATALDLVKQSEKK